MKINKADLQVALEKVKPGLANKELIEQATSFAFLGGRVVTYNDEISISAPVKGLEKVTGAVKAQALYEFLNKVKKEEIDLEWEDNQVVIKAGRAKAGLIFESEVKLPIDEEITDIGEWNKLPKGFLAALKLCYPCCSRDMAKPVLTCVHINGKVIEASDSYQIIQYKLGGPVPGKKFLIPANSVKELVKYAVTEITVGESWAHFRTEDETVIFSVRIVGGDFPPVAQYLEMDDGVEFSFPEDIREVLARANVFVNRNLADAGSVPVAFVETKGGRLKLSAKNDSGWFEETMRVTNKDANFTFSIGIEFLTKLFEKLQTCIIGSRKILFKGENWEHVVAVFPNKDK